MSVLGKKWEIINKNESLSIIDKILENRGLTDQQAIEAYLKTSFKKGLHNPFTMKNMERAVERIKKGIQNNERIMIFGDYDVDGISGTAIMVHTLKMLNAKVSYRLPHRVENGYGLSDEFIEEFADLKVGLLITVDCGISCKSQVDLAQEKGIDVIITDHHAIPEEFPESAYAILHPMQKDCQYPFKGLTGAGVSYKLASALIADQSESHKREEYLYSLLDLTSLGTVADLGPLVGENRIIVKYGLEALQDTKWHGLNFLKEYAGIDPDAKLDINSIGYRLGPRINAAGRIANPYYALQLLLYDKVDEKGKILAEHLEKLNQKRQQMVFEALDELREHFIAEGKDQKILIAWNKNWHVGILGLLAARCVEKYMLPAIILQDLGDELVGSCRSPEFFNLVDALSAHSHLLKNFGGHVQAAGFTIAKDKLPEFVQSMEKYAGESILHSDWHPTINIDCEVNHNDLDERLMKHIEQMEPFGIGNEQPTFLVKNVSPSSIRRVGKESNHLFFEAGLNTKSFSVIGFKMGEFEQFLKDHEMIDLVCHLERNVWKGISKLQLRAIDFSASH